MLLLVLSLFFLHLCLHFMTSILANGRNDVIMEKGLFSHTQRKSVTGTSAIVHCNMYMKCTRVTLNVQACDTCLLLQSC